MGLFPFKYACFFDLIYGHVPGHRSRSVFLGWQADGSQRKLAGCYATAFSCNLTHCRYTDRPGICQSAECGGISAGCRFLDYSTDFAYSRTVYRSPFNERLDSARSRWGLRNTRLVSFAKIYGTIHLRKTSAIKDVIWQIITIYRHKTHGGFDTSRPPILYFIANSTKKIS